MLGLGLFLEAHDLGLVVAARSPGLGLELETPCCVIGPCDFLQR